MYESPIKVFQGELETQLEGEILKAVHRVGVTVDRDELIRALRYDREQYQKGFDDAKRDAVVVTRCKDCKHFKNYGKTSLLIDGKNIKAGWCHRRARYDEEYRMPPDGCCSYGEREDGGNADENRDPEN